MQQRQPRLGDIVDDYCPRERRLTNHAVVAMIEDDIRLTRCTTCDSEHDYKHARVPKLRKKHDPALAAAAVLAAPAPRRVPSDASAPHEGAPVEVPPPTVDMREAGLDEALELDLAEMVAGDDHADQSEMAEDDVMPPRAEEGPVHRQLIRAQLPRHEGQPPSPRQAPDFTIRQPTGRPNRFRFRPDRGGNGGNSGSGLFSHGGNGNRGNGNTSGNGRGQGPRSSGRPPMASRAANRQGGRKRSK